MGDFIECLLCIIQYDTCIHSFNRFYVVLSASHILSGPVHTASPQTRYYSPQYTDEKTGA